MTAIPNISRTTGCAVTITDGTPSSRPRRSASRNIQAPVCPGMA
jgi:hypothetical protein